MDIKVEITIPKELLSQGIVQDSIAQMMTKKTAPEVKALFRRTVYGWANKPTFKQKLTRRSGYMSESIWADGQHAQQYAWVNFGTEPHAITPKASGYPLKFRWGGKGSYRASSRPRVIQSGRHYQTGPIVNYMSVNHPGFEAREFDQTIANEYRPTFIEDMQDAISIAAAKTAQSNN